MGNNIVRCWLLVLIHISIVAKKVVLVNKGNAFFSYGDHPHYSNLYLELLERDSQEVALEDARDKLVTTNAMLANAQKNHWRIFGNSASTPLRAVVNRDIPQSHS